MMNDCGTGKHLEGNGRGLLDVLSFHVPCVTEKSPRTFSIRMADDPTEI